MNNVLWQKASNFTKRAFFKKKKSWNKTELSHNSRGNQLLLEVVLQKILFLTHNIQKFNFYELRINYNNSHKEGEALKYAEELIHILIVLIHNMVQ